MTKKLLVLVLGLFVALGIAAVAQENAGKSETSTGKAAAAPLKMLKGTVKSEGDKVTFVSDTDQKSWEVMNPETLKDHVGHHVQVSAHVYADKDQIHVMKVKMLKEGKEKPSTM
jgi:ABC-type glycerol-3-phosphate transport system substrate-binding protein